MKNEKLPLSLFQEIEADLCDRLIHSNGSTEEDQTNGPLEFIQNIVENIKSEFDSLVEDGERQKYSQQYSKNNQNCKVFYFNSVENMVRTKLVAKRRVR